MSAHLPNRLTGVKAFAQQLLIRSSGNRNALPAPRRGRFIPAQALRVMLLLIVFTLPVSLGLRAATYTVTSTGDAGAGTLRQAMTDANTNPGADIIQFNIGGGGAQTITITSSLPTIASELQIDGTTQSGYSSTPLITVKYNGVIFNLNSSALNVDIKALAFQSASGTGGAVIASSGCIGLTVESCTVTNMIYAFSITGGKDVRILNNTVTNTGNSSSFAIDINGVGAAALTSKILMTGNTLVSGTDAIRLQNMTDQVIGDGTVSGANIVLPDGGLGGFAGFGLSITNLDNLTIDNIDCSYYTTSSTYSGYGLSLTNCDVVTVKNCAINNRVRGFYATGGTDLRLLDNTFTNTGNYPFYAIDISNVGAASLASKIYLKGNTISGNYGVQLTNISNQIIGDASVASANIILADGSSPNIAATFLNLNNVDSLIIDNVDGSYSTAYNGFGFALSGCDSVIIRNCAINNRSMGLYVNGGSDLRVSNNTFTTSGNYPYFAVSIDGVAAVNLAARIALSGNTISGNYGIQLANMPNQIIGDVSVANANVVIPDGSLGNVVVTALTLTNLDNLTIDNVDVSYTTVGYNGTGLSLAGCDVVTMKNCAVNNRVQGLYVNGGSDLQVLNNTFTNTGAYPNYAVTIDGVAAVHLPSHIAVSGNAITGNYGIQLSNMANQVIGDASVSGANVVLADGSFSNISQLALSLNNLDSLVVDNLDLSYTTAFTGVGLNMSNCDSAIVRNCTINNRAQGVSVSGGSDMRLLNNIMNNTGTNPYYAINIDNVAAKRLASHVLVSGNTFAGGVQGMSISNMADQVIGDASVSGANIILADGTLPNFSGHVLNLNNLDNCLVDNLDLSRTASGVNGTALALANCDVITVQNCTVANRNAGIQVTLGSAVQLLNNSFTNTGNNNVYCIDINSVNATVAMPKRILVTGNTFSGGTYGIALSNLTDQVIGDAGITGANMVLPDGSLPAFSGNVLSLNNVDNALIDNLDLSRTTAGFGGTAIGLVNCDVITVQNCTVINRNAGLQVILGSAVSVLNNSFTNTGNTTSCIDINTVAATVAMPRRLLMTGNTFSGGVYGISLSNLSNQIIGDAGVSGANISLPDGTLTGFSNTALSLNTVDSSVLDNIDAGMASGIGSTGITVSSCNALVVRNCSVVNRQQGMSFIFGKDLSVLNNTFGGSNTSLSINSVSAAYFPRAIQVTGNTFSSGIDGLNLSNLKNLIIGDASVAGANVMLPDGSLAALTGTPVTLNNIDSTAIDNIDVSRATGTGSVGINLNSCDALSITNCAIANRNVGITAIFGSDFAVTGNVFTNCGLSGSYALNLNIVAASAYRRLLIKDNTYNAVGNGLQLQNMSDLVIGDMTTTGANVEICSDDKLLDASGTMLSLNSITNSTVDHINLTYAASNTNAGIGLSMSSCTGITVNKTIVCSRITGITAVSCSNMTFTGNSIKSCNTGLNYNSNITPLPVFTNNTIANNGTGLTNGSGSVTLNASNNYWGAANGPSNIGGAGNPYSGLVTASPFLSSESNAVQTAKGTFIVSAKELTGLTSLVCGPGAAQTFTVRGQCLESNVTMTAPAGFEFSTNGTTYANAVTIPVSGGNITGEPLTVYARIAANLPQSVLSGTVTVTGAYVCPPLMTLSGSVSTPEIAVSGNAIAIADGNATTNTTDNTDFGSTLTGTPISKTFTIDNTGNYALGVTGVTIGGPDAASFSVTTPPAASVNMAGTTTFTVMFNAGGAGTKNATINIANDDCDETAYDFAITATANCPAITATTSATATSCPNSSDGSISFAAPAGGASPYQYSVDNGGNYQASASFSGLAAASYNVIVQDVNGCTSAAASLAVPASADNTPPTITCAADVVTVVSANNCDATVTLTAPVIADNCGSVTLANDHASNIFPVGTTTVVWTATDASGNHTTCAQLVTVQAPEINVQGNGNSIADGSTTISGTGSGGIGTDLGNGPSSSSFTIQNTGAVALSIGNITFQGANPGDFSVTASPAASVTGGGSTTFVVACNPSAVGTRNAIVHVENSDCDEADFDFAVQGTGVCTAPSFTVCPTNISAVNTASGSCTAIVTYAATAAGQPAPDLTYAFTGATTGNGSGTGSGSAFGKGTTNVTVTATNSCGFANCSFSVFITDSEAPVVTCAAPVTISTTPGQCTGTTTLTQPTITDNCPLNMGNGMKFDGSNDYIYSTNNINLGTSFTWECWLKTTVNNPAYASVLSATDNPSLISGGSGGSRAQLNFDGSGKLRATDGPLVFGTTNVSDGKWHHAALVVTASSSKLYIDGKLDGTGGSDGATTNRRLVIGAEHYLSLYANVAVDEVRVWSVARTQAEIQATMYGGFPLPQSNLALYYKFDQGIADGTNTGLVTVTDLSTNANTGNLANINNAGTTSNWTTGVVFPLTNDAPLVYPIGNTTVTWTGRDASNNSNTCTQTVTVQAPEINVQSNSTNITDGSNAAAAITGNNTDMGSSVINTTVTKTYTIQNTGTSNLAVSGISVSGGDVAMFNNIGTLTPASPIAAGGSATFTVSFTPTSTGQKSTTLHIANSDCDEADYDVVLIGTGSCQAPVFTTCPGNQNGLSTANTCNPAISYTTAVTGTPAPALTYVFSGATIGSGSGDGSGSNFNVGVTTVTVTATNACGARTCIFTVTVQDQIAPVITCPSNITVNNDNNSCGAVVNYAVAATDNCTINVGQTFNFTGNTQSYTVPAGVTTLRVKAWGGGGGSGGTDCQGIGLGGGGAYATDVIGVTPGEVLTIYVGGGGAAGPNSGNSQATLPTVFGYGNGGRGGTPGGQGFSGAGGGGGGGTAILRGSSVLVVAGAGGGGSGAGCSGVGMTGGGGGVNGTNGVNATGGAAGASGSTVGGDGGNRGSGNDGGGGGGGGGGYLGGLGGAAAASDVGGGGGGGGTSFATTVLNGNGQTPGNSADAVRCATCAIGGGSGTTTTTAGGPGTLVISGLTLTRTAGLASGSVFPIGTTTNTYTATDASGNVSIPCSFTVTVTDNQAPVLTCPGNQTVNSTSTFCTGTYTLNPITDNCTGSKWSYTLTGLTTGTTSNLTGSNTLTLNKGITHIAMTGVDAAGNAATPCSFDVNVVDNQRPTIQTCPGTQTMNVITGTCAANYTIASPVSDNCPGAIWNYALSGATTGSATAIASGTSSGLVSFNKGTTLVTLSATDASGNTTASACTFNVVVNDNIVPTITAIGLTGGTHHTSDDGTGNCTTTVALGTPTTADNCTVASLAASVGGVPITPATYAFGIGTTTVRWTVKDGSANTAFIDQTVIVADDEHPTITAPTNISVNADNGHCYATVTSLGSPTTGDNCSVNPATNNAPANNQYAVGINTVTWTATDPAGNQQTATQTITVTDNQDPFFTSLPLSAVTLSGYCQPTAVNLAVPGTNDYCGIQSTIASVGGNVITPATYQFQNGMTTTVTWTVTDIHGRTASTTQNVTVTAGTVNATTTVTPSYTMSGQEIQTIYLGYPGATQQEVLQVNASGTGSSYTYAWKKGTCNGDATTLTDLSNTTSGTSSYTWQPTIGDVCNGNDDNAYLFSIKVTDDHGCTTTTTKKLNVVNPYTDAQHANVQICHKVAVRGGSVTQQMIVPQAQVATHLSHGDGLGNCVTFTGVKTNPLETVAEDQKATIYPNPTTGIFILELSEIRTQADILITDIQGKVVATKTMKKDEVPTATFDLGNLARGMYLIQLRDGDYNYRAKIILQ